MTARVDLRQGQDKENEIIDRMHCRQNSSPQRLEVEVEARHDSKHHAGKKDEGYCFMQAHCCMTYLSFMIMQKTGSNNPSSGKTAKQGEQGYCPYPNMSVALEFDLLAEMQALHTLNPQIGRIITQQDGSELNNRMNGENELHWRPSEKVHC